MCICYLRDWGWKSHFFLNPQPPALLSTVTPSLWNPQITTQLLSIVPSSETLESQSHKIVVEALYNFSLSFGWKFANSSNNFSSLRIPHNYVNQPSKLKICKDKQQLEDLVSQNFPQFFETLKGNPNPKAET